MAKNEMPKVFVSKEGLIEWLGIGRDTIAKLVDAGILQERIWGVRNAFLIKKVEQLIEKVYDENFPTNFPEEQRRVAVEVFGTKKDTAKRIYNQNKALKEIALKRTMINSNN